MTGAVEQPQRGRGVPDPLSRVDLYGSPLANRTKNSKGVFWDSKPVSEIFQKRADYPGRPATQGAICG